MSEPTKLLERISSSFPDLKWESYKYIDEGWDHEVIILDDKYVFRFPDDEEYTQNLNTEVELLKTLKPLVSVNIPSYSFISPDKTFAGYEIVRGVNLKKSYFDSLSTESKDEIARQLAGLLSVIHTLDKNKVKVTMSPFDSYQEVNRKILSEKVKGLLSEEDYAIAQQILSDVDELLEHPVPSVIIHSDVYSRHLFWDSENNKLGVIDFSDASVSDPAFDFSEIHEYGLEFVKKVYEYYTGPKDETFLERAWIYQRWAGVNMMADHFESFKTSFEVARETFDWVKKPLQ